MHRSLERAPEGLCEICVGDRLGSGGVARTLHLRLACGPAEHSDHVVDVDPWDVLPAAGDRTADPQAEERQHRGEGARTGGEHDTCAGPHDAETVFGGLGLPLPLRHHTGEEVVALSRRLVERLVPARAVVARGRLRDEYLRARAGR